MDNKPEIQERGRMKRILAIILLVILVMTATTVIAMSPYPKIYERLESFEYCSLLDNGHLMVLETQGDEWTTTKYKRVCHS